MLHFFFLWNHEQLQSCQQVSFDWTGSIPGSSKSQCIWWCTNSRRLLCWDTCLRMASPEGMDCPAVWTTIQELRFSLATFGITAWTPQTETWTDQCLFLASQGGQNPVPSADLFLSVAFYPTGKTSKRHSKSSPCAGPFWPSPSSSPLVPDFKPSSPAFYTLPSLPAPYTLLGSLPFEPPPSLHEVQESMQRHPHSLQAGLQKMPPSLLRCGRIVGRLQNK